jgi:hypothetical protein
LDKKSAEVFQQPPTEKAVDDFLNESQSITLVTTPDPTVRFPSRIANREPSSQATGRIRLTDKRTPSPGIAMSASRISTRPVTLVVPKKN